MIDAAYTLTLDLPGLNKVVEKYISTAIEEAAEIIKSSAAQNVSDSSGELKKSLKVSSKDMKSTVSTDLKYAASVEYGSGPHTAPLSQLQAWALKKFGDANIGGAIWQSIRENGTKPHPFMRPALDENRDEVKAKIAKVLRRKLR